MLGVLCSSVLLMYLTVGPYAERLQLTKKKAVYYSIDSINDKVLTRVKQPIEIKRNEKSIVVHGWVAGIDHEIEEVIVSVGGNSFLAFYGIERMDVAKYYNNPNYRYSGFKVEIPTPQIKSGVHALYLKVLLKNRPFYWHPDRRIWVKLE